MYEIVNEGKAVIRIKKTGKISKGMEVFYNPIMKLNRDISILLLDSMDKREMQIALPLAGSGVRGIRFLKELKKNKIKTINFNDYNKKAIESIKNNLKLNKINNFTIIKNSINKSNNNEDDDGKTKIMICNEDANLFLLNSQGFDYIDIDPFGTSNPYLDSAVKRISRNGVLAVTNTDTAALTGTYPKAGIRKYWSMQKKDYMMHETGLRILIRKIQLVGMQYEKALIPIFSYFKNHYFRVFFECVKGKKLCDEIALGHGMFNEAGPLWTGNLWNKRLINKMYGSLLRNINKKILTKKNNQNNNKELLKFLKIIKEESKLNVVGFYDMHKTAKKRGLNTTTRKEEVIRRINKKGYKAANTHFSGTGIRTDIAYEKFLKLL